MTSKPTADLLICTLTCTALFPFANFGGSRMCAHNALAKKPEISDLNCHRFVYSESMHFTAENSSKGKN